MRWFVGCLVLVGIFLSPIRADASNIGITVGGTLEFGAGGTNYFDPANGHVPAGFGNAAGTSVAVADPLIEFGYHDQTNIFGDVTTFDLTANFTGDQLFVSYAVVGFADSLAPFTLTFVSPDFQGLTLSEASDALGVTGLLQGTTLTVTWPAFFTDLEDGPTAVFDLTGRETPEPGTVALVSAGVIAAVSRRRRARQNAA